VRQSRGTASTLLWAAAVLALRVQAAVPESPQLLFKDLFVAVQTADIFPDSKLFADAVPREPPAQILARYHAEHPQSGADLARFVARHFTLPSSAGPAESVPELTSVQAHIDALWPLLRRSTAQVPPYGSLLPLPRPYVVPGGRFREIYYWDSYFTMLGLAESGRHDLVADMVADFADLIDRYGHVPNGTRTYYLSRSQPPLFYAMVELLGSAHGRSELARFLPQLKAEEAFWMAGAQQLAPGTAARRVVRLVDGALLNRYWDDLDLPRDESYREDQALAGAGGRPAAELFRDLRAGAESGWDFGSRWFADGRSRASIVTTQIVPVDLNSLLYALEQAIASGCHAQADEDCAREYAGRALARRAALDRYLWDAAAGAYLDYRWTRARRMRGVTAAMLYPLFVGAASSGQAAAVAATARARLLRAGGLVTTTRVTGEQWDAPNGWAPLQWIAVAGLRRYGRSGLAASVACRFMVNVENVYRKSGKLVEKYDVVTPGRGGGGGEYPLQDGFGWTNGVLRKLLVLYPAYAAARVESACPVP
jgi:alpha,alpha-trehalase